jgi:hypothetical protein
MQKRAGRYPLTYTLFLLNYFDKAHKKKNKVNLTLNNIITYVSVIARAEPLRILLLNNNPKKLRLKK